MKKIICILLTVLLLLQLCACGNKAADTDNVTAKPSIDSLIPASSTAGEAEVPEELYTIATSAAASDILNTPALAQNLYLPLMVNINGETHSDVLADTVRVNGYTWKVSVKEGLTDTAGNTFTAADLAALLNAEPMASDVQTDEEGYVTFSVKSDLGSAFEDLLCNTFAYTQAAASAAANGVPAGFGPYQIETISDETAVLTANPNCPLDAEDPCAGAAIERLQVNFGVSTADQLSQLQAGTIDGALDLTEVPASAASVLLYTGEGRYLIANTEKENSTELMSAISFSTLSSFRSDSVATEGLFNAGFPGTPDGCTPAYPEVTASEEETEETAASTSKKTEEEPEKETLILLCDDADKDIANEIADQLESATVTVSVKTDATPETAEDWDLAIISVDAYNAYEVLSYVFAPVNEEKAAAEPAAEEEAEGDAEGETEAAAETTAEAEEEPAVSRYGCTNTEVLQVAELLGTVYGENRTNLDLFTGWIADSYAIRGLDAVVRYSGFTGTPAVVTSHGAMFGSISAAVSDAAAESEE